MESTVADIDFQAEVKALHDEMIARRRDFHQHPELAFEEVRTSGIIANELRNLGMEVQTGIAKTGIVAILEGDEDGPTVMYRADMDALPIQEANDHEFVSTVARKMHACGHDGHMAIALGVAKIMTKYRHRLKGRIKFVFQPGEEGAGGALAMIKEGILDDDPMPDVTLGIHLWQPLALGTVGMAKGAIMSGSSTFQITVRGKGGHAALPHTTIDSVACTGQLISALHTIVGRRMNAMDGAVVLSVTGLHSSSMRHNIIPETVEIMGTFRTFNAYTSEMLEQHIRDVSRSVCESVGCVAEVKVKHLTIPLINDSEVVNRMRRIVAPIVGEKGLDDTARTMASEDMSYFLDDIPGMFFLVGCRSSSADPQYGHHHPRFDFDEEALATGANIISAAIADYLITD
ncbi:MAG: amidohydrolase [Anaerolineae bacterium]|nr:amidohydrolase [Anaerolineae bacterium]MDQ7033754.1 amidohydrolase [Anaerolineae bacterium]